MTHVGRQDLLQILDRDGAGEDAIVAPVIHTLIRAHEPVAWVKTPQSYAQTRPTRGSGISWPTTWNQAALWLAGAIPLA